MSGKRKQSSDWLMLFAYLAYLRTVRAQQNPERVLLRLISIVGIVLGIVALVVAGAPEKVSELIRLWPIMP